MKVIGLIGYTLILVREENKPNTFSNQITTKITTTTFRILFIFRSMGIYELTSQSKTPTTISTIKTFSKGIKMSLNVYSKLSYFTKPAITQFIV